MQVELYAHAALHCCFAEVQVLQDRLEAVELMLIQKPIVSGRYSGHAFHYFVRPLHPAFQDLCNRCAHIEPLRMHAVKG